MKEKSINTHHFPRAIVQSNSDMFGINEMLNE
ncbi:hypothetical protein T09_3119 [Trichinella sp. T9]|nr:hypothetical protein T09_3119 [Trichinella sp. T9]